MRGRVQGPGVISVSAPPLETSSLRLREQARHAHQLRLPPSLTLPYPSFFSVSFVFHFVSLRPSAASARDSPLIRFRSRAFAIRLAILPTAHYSEIPKVRRLSQWTERPFVRPAHRSESTRSPCSG